MFCWPDGRVRDVLPIDSSLDHILDLSEQHPVVILQALTGAGKTTRIGQAAVLRNPKLFVNMTVPRRAAVRWNGKRIAYELGCEPGQLVGWRLFGEESVYSAETRLRLRVDQSLANEIRRNGGILQPGLYIVDEAHERSIPTDLLLGFIKEALPKSPGACVIVTSATIDPQKFSDFFGGAPIVTVPGRCFDVETRIERLQHGEHHSAGAARAAVQVWQEFCEEKLVTPAEEGGYRIVSQGTVLILLPGKEDIKAVKTRLKSELSASNQQGTFFQICECNGESSAEEQDAIQMEVPPRTLRFVCATEVVRTSVTVRETVGVIDSLQVKRLVTDERGVGHLTKVAVSKAEADQAKGRAGRTQSGFYIPISYGTEYEHLEPYPAPAILRSPISNVVLQVAAMGRSARDFSFIDAPAPERISVAIERLQWIEALDLKEEITETGKLLLQFPLDPERAKALITADKLGVMPEAIVVAATLEVEGFFHRPKDRAGQLKVGMDVLRLVFSYLWDDSPHFGRPIYALRDMPVDLPNVQLIEEEMPHWVDWEAGTIEGAGIPHEEGLRWVADILRKHWAGETQNDYVAIVRAYRAYKKEEREVLAAFPGKANERKRTALMLNWCMGHFVNYKRICLAEEVMYMIRDELQMSPLQSENGFGDEREFDPDALTKSLLSGLIDHVAALSHRNEYTSRLSHPDTLQVSWGSACRGCPLVLVGGLQKLPIQGGRNFIRLADVAAPIKPEWLQEMFPQLYTTHPISDLRYDSEVDQIFGRQDSMFIGLPIGSQHVVAEQSPEAAAVFREWLVGELVH